MTAVSFEQLGLPTVLVKHLALLGYELPTPVQKQAIPAILSTNDVMACAQTGTGKTAAFTLPLISHLIEKTTESDKPQALILAPTRELSQQIQQSIERYSQPFKINAVAVYGGASIETQISKLSKKVDILVATPGRLLDLLIKNVADLSEVNYLVFDEADRMLDLGFKEEIDRILAYIKVKPLTLLFSATFDDAIYTMAKSLLSQPQIIKIANESVTAAKVEQVVYTVDAEKKLALIAHLVLLNDWSQLLIFTRKKETADKVCQMLSSQGIQAKAIHGDKSQANREKTLASFKQGEFKALVATDVAARGLDIEALPIVINYELPFLAEDYVHRIGRTGRANKSGQAISLITSSEQPLLEAIERIIDSRLMQQWYPGFEPDLSLPSTPTRKMSKSKQRALALSGKGSPMNKRKKQKRRI